MKEYQRTEDGAVTYVSVREAMAELNHAMMEGKRKVFEMSSGRGHHTITYKNGRSVQLVELEKDEPAPVETDSKGRRIVTAKGKRYVVGTITPARPRTRGAVSWIPEAYVSYWSERNGETFGATRHATASRKPGTIGRAIWDAINS